MAFRKLHITSPHMTGRDVKDAQWLLAGNGRFKENYKPGPIDGSFGVGSRDATRRAKYKLGYPKAHVDGFWGGVFGPEIYSYLLPLTSDKAKRLPLAYRIRRAARAKAAAQAASIKLRALNIALAEYRSGVHEWGHNNDSKYGRWYGLNYEPWCAMFVTYCFVTAGDKRIFHRGSVTAWSMWASGAAPWHPLLRVTTNPQPGDIVEYHRGQGHIGIFYRWIDRAHGVFEAVEGNTSSDANGSQDNGGEVAIQRRDTGWCKTVFVSVAE